MNGLLCSGSLAAAPGMSISVDQVEQSIPCVRLSFHLPREHNSTGVDTIPVLVPTAGVGTGIFRPHDIFYALLEEVIVWLARVGPKNTLVRLYRNNYAQPIARSYSLDWHLLHNGFELFISSLRLSHNPFPGLGRLTGSFGMIEVTEARTPSDQVSG